ncbi:G2-specific serine/threonine protein kinase, partial [Cryomyces antarcticus]
MSCLQVFPDKRPDTAQLLNLPIVKLMRKEQEVVMLGQRMKAEKELASRKLKEADEKYARLEAEKEAMRMEIDAVVRREWEVKARLEIDRQVQLELDKLRKSFEIELGRKVEDEVAKRVEAFQQNAGGPTPPAEENVRSSTPTFDDDSGQPQPQPHPPTFKNTASTTDETDDDFPSTTDLSSLSIDDSPI